MGGVICLSGAKRFVQVTVIVGLISGVGVWLTGASNSLVVGASGLVFGYLTYLVARGIVRPQPAVPRRAARRCWPSTAG